MPYDPKRDDIRHLAHDVRGLLACVQLEICALSRNENLEVRLRAATLQRASDRIVGYCRAAAAQTNDVIAHESAELTTLLEEVASHLIILSAFEDIDIQLECEDAKLTGIEAQAIHRIVSNLGRNAVTAMINAGAGKLSICASLVRDGLRIDIRDTGPGLPEPILAQLFPPIDRPCAWAGRLGLGLASSLRLAKALGGELVLLKSDRRGAAFRLSCPLRMTPCARSEPPRFWQDLQTVAAQPIAAEES